VTRTPTRVPTNSHTQNLGSTSERSEAAQTKAKPGTAQRPRRGLDVPRSSVTAPDGLLIVDKPAGVTSHDVVAAVRRLASTRKVGHAGTLDPMATGVLVIGIGKATRLLTHIVGADKAYSATVQLGVSTDTDDAEGAVVAMKGSHALENQESIDEFEDAVEAELNKLRGEIMQVPTTVSAIKIDGERAHALHRAGEKVDIPARPVTISRLERTSEIKSRIVSIDEEDVAVNSFDMDVECSSGTYVRAIARDLGKALGTGGILTRLRRTRVGKWTLDHAVTIEDLVANVEGQAGEAAGGAEPIPVISLTQACVEQFASLDLEYEEAEAMRHGNVTRLRPRTPDGEIAACLWDGSVRALVKRADDRYEPVVVFATGPLD
jgi:tRNA pseudouridine55 synthase